MSNEPTLKTRNSKLKTMLPNYFKIAIRSLLQNRFYTMLNIAGLSIGLATGLLILLWVEDERSFDGFHPNVERIYRESTHLKLADRVLNLSTCPAPHAAYALREIPEVEQAVRVVEAGSALVRQGTVAAVEKRGAFVDTSFFQVFKTELLVGNPAQKFEDPNSVVLTETFARKYFGTPADWSALLGRVLQVENEPVVVVAILRDFPGNTGFQYDYLRPYTYLKARFQPNDLWESREEDWGNCGDATFFLLRPGAEVAAVERKLGELTHTHNKLDRGTYYKLQPLAQTHLYGVNGSDVGAQTVRIFGLVGLFILLIACINYINLATAKAGKRAKEVGLRKAIGANRGQLVAQFLIESSLVFLLAAVLALLLTGQFLPFCNALADKKLFLDWASFRILGLLASVLGMALLLAGIYPSLVLSAFKPLQAMKGHTSTGSERQARLRKGLVVLQFACSSVLLLAMLVMGGQMHFIKTKNLGYERDNVFQIELSARADQNRAAIVRALENSPGIEDVTAASGDILRSRISTGDVEWDGKATDNLIKISPLSVAPDFLRFFKMTLVEGTDFSDTPADATAFIVNETTAAQMGPGSPIGKRFKLWETEGRVIGVVKDFHFASLHTNIQPAVFYANPARNNLVCVKTTGKYTDQSLAAAETVWKRFEPAYPFDYAFMDETFDKMYRNEQRSSQLFYAFAAIALLISCLGLFGLSAFTVEQRNKEIGIRKVLGASVANVTGLLAKDFMVLVLLAFLLASPVAWYCLQGWLSNFAYRIDLQWWMFAVAGLAAVGVAFLTVGFQSVKAALANPVQSLRSE